MSESIGVKVRMSDGRITCGHVAIHHDSESTTWALRFDGIGIGEQNFEGPDLFEAMTELRKTLERSGAQLLCAGARPEVFPSGMSRGMGGGRKAYVTRIGEGARMADLVDIFEYAAPESIGTVRQQADFHARWIESLSKR